MMEFGLIVASLQRHRIAALLIVVEIVLACAVLCNAAFMIGQRVESLSRPDAVDEAGISFINMPTVNRNAATDIPRNLAALKAIAGVKQVAITGAVPAIVDGGGPPFSTTSEAYAAQVCSQFMMTEGGDQALGLHLLRGRMFTPEEYAGSTLDQAFSLSTHLVVITEEFAQLMWPGQDALGKQLYRNVPGFPAASFTVIGVVANVLTPSDNGLGFVPDVRVFDGSSVGEKRYFSGCFFPLSPSTDALQNYIIRTAPSERYRVLREAMHMVTHLQPGTVMTGSTFEDARNKKFAGVRSMVQTLVVVCIIMLAVTAFGIVGLSSFWVQQRRRQIGIRRALGARRKDVLRYFQIENLILTSTGIAIGIGAAFAVNLYLMQQYQMSRMPASYYLLSAVVLWSLGQLAVFGPALRAAAVPPVVATRGA